MRGGKRPPRHLGSISAALALATASGALGLAAPGCLLPGYELTSSSGNGGSGATTDTTTTGGGGTGGTTTTTSDTESTTTGGGGAGGTTTTTSDTESTTTGGGGTGGTTTTTTTSTVVECVDCPEWVVLYGSGNVDHPHGLAVGASSQIAVGGENLGTISGALPAWAGAADGFVSRFTIAGDQLSTQGYPGDNPAANNQAVKHVLHAGDDLVVAGEFEGTVRLAAGVTLPSVAGAGKDVFVARYKANGDLVWSKRIGDAGADTVAGIALDPAGNVVVAGTYTATLQVETHLLEAFGDNDGANSYVLKIDGGGAFLLDPPWQPHAWGSLNDDSIAGVAVDAAGNVILAGHHLDHVAFDNGSSITNFTSVADGNVIVIDPDGNYTLQKPLGGMGIQRVLALAVSADGFIHVAGLFDGTIDFGNVALMDTTIGGQDLFVAKIGIGGMASWAKPLPNPGVLEPIDLAIAPDGDVVLAGGFSGTSTFFGPSAVTSAGTDAFVVRLDASGTFVKRHVFTGAGMQHARALAFDPAGGLVVAGELDAACDFGTGTQYMPIPPLSDIFLLRLLP